MFHHSLLKKLAVLLTFGAPLAGVVQADPVGIGSAAPDFELPLQDGSSFRLNSRKSIGWTILYFYPKADTPGCTRQACAYRDGVRRIREENAEVFGISTDSVADIAAFHQKHHLSFGLLADANGQVTERYGVKMPLIPLAKRWTFIVDPEGVIRDINQDVDPATDAGLVLEKIQRLKTEKTVSTRQSPLTEEKKE